MIVAFPKLETAKNIKNILVRNGFRVVGVCTTAAGAIAFADGLVDGLLICSYQLADMQCLELREYLPSEFELLVIASARVIEENLGNEIVSLTLPLKINELLSTVGMMEETLRHRRKRRHETKKVRSPQDDKTITEAKELLMRRNHMTEEEAYRYMQKTSMDSSRNFVETAQMILALLN
ncbi:MAG: ANTAR domain-containing protein [Lachnospiraceae bacterium]|jgi:response regulator NasT|nr:ANTAR domain-containing protein [Lachnospiraceae bacterium]